LPLAFAPAARAASLARQERRFALALLAPALLVLLLTTTVPLVYRWSTSRGPA
jgi:multiple sugar transport system permease protein